jgi:oxidase EvaA
MYKKELKKYFRNVSSKLSDDVLEFHFECLQDWSVLHTIDEIEEWYTKKVNSQSMTVTEIPLKDCDMWEMDDNKIYHQTSEFFTVKGYRIKSNKREVDGWSQPMIEQVGKDGGILGIVRKRFDGIPHYLLEAKFEPGNTNLVQISPTLQATFSNINAAHLGNRPHYLKYFLKPDKHKIHFSNWLSEDGGRFLDKRNLNMLIEVVDPFEVVNDNFIWMSMYQIKECLRKDSWVANSVRSIISHL